MSPSANSSANKYNTTSSEFFCGGTGRRKQFKSSKQNSQGFKIIYTATRKNDLQKAALRNTLKRHGFKCAGHTNARFSMSTCLGNSSDSERDSTGLKAGLSDSRLPKEHSRDGFSMQRTPGSLAGKEGFKEAKSAKIRNYYREFVTSLTHTLDLWPLGSLYYRKSC